jgi:hypothetical protein
MSMCSEMGINMHMVPGWEAQESLGRGGTCNGVVTQRPLQRSKASRSGERQLVTGWVPDAAVTSRRLLERGTLWRV